MALSTRLVVGLLACLIAAGLCRGQGCSAPDGTPQACFPADGACACNGHASECATENANGTRVCRCEHNTAGDQCEVCLASHSSQPWGGATPECAIICVACPTCYDRIAEEFDATLTLYNELLELNITALPLDLLAQYRSLLAELLGRAISASNRETALAQDLAAASMETDDLSGLVDLFEANVTSAESTVEELTLRLADLPFEELRLLVQRLEAQVRGEIGDLLAEAIALSALLESEIAQLVNLTAFANGTSFEHEALSLELLEQITGAFQNATQALQLISETIAIQNSTLEALLALETDILPRLEELVNSGAPLLERLRLDLPDAVVLATEVLVRAMNTTVPDYTPDLQRLEMLRTQNQELLAAAVEVRAQIIALTSNFTDLNVTAQALLAESRALNMEADELLARAHAAFTSASRSVEAGDEITREALDLLRQLNQTLQSMGNFTAGLAEVLRNIELAENQSSLAGEAAERGVLEVGEASLALEQAATLLEEASASLVLAFQVANNASDVAAGFLAEATAFANLTDQLADNVSMATDDVNTLGEDVLGDRDAIAMATDAAQETLRTGSDLQTRIQAVQSTLANLSAELNSTVLLPQERLAAVNATLVPLERQAATNQALVDDLTQQVGELQRSADELRSRYTTLRQHRDLLETILENVANLDCRLQFQRS